MKWNLSTSLLELPVLFEKVGVEWLYYFFGVNENTSAEEGGNCLVELANILFSGGGVKIEEFVWSLLKSSSFIN